MLATAIVMFREVLEIALILCVILAATRDISGRTRWILVGLGTGIAGSVLIAVFADVISAAAEGMGQEILNASILLAAAAMISWTVIWMRTHGREMSQKIKQVGQAVKSGDVPLYSVAIVIALAVFREGSEMVLFSYGLIAAGTAIPAFLAGCALGLGGGILVGTLIYLGLLRVSPSHFFTVTGWLLTLLAAGMAAKGVGFLVAAGYLPELGNPIWDTSAILSERSIIGEVLNILIGYAERPSGVQLLTYILTIGVISVSLKLLSRRPYASRVAA